MPSCNNTSLISESPTCSSNDPSLQAPSTNGVDEFVATGDDVLIGDSIPPPLPMPLSLTHLFLIHQNQEFHCPFCMSLQADTNEVMVGTETATLAVSRRHHQFHITNGEERMQFLLATLNEALDISMDVEASIVVLSETESLQRFPDESNIPDTDDNSVVQ
jgi:hypothetical protein